MRRVVPGANGKGMMFVMSESGYENAVSAAQCEEDTEGGGAAGECEEISVGGGAAAPAAVEVKRTPRVYSAEFWRFMFTVLVTLYHLEIFYQRKLMPSGTTAVEFFFIMAGFTIAMSAARRVDSDGKRELSPREAHSLALSYLKKKLKLIYPLLAVTLVVAIVVIPLATPATMFSATANTGFWARLGERLGVLINSEWEWLIMVGTPAGFNNVTAAAAPIVPLWFLTQLIVVGYLYTFLINRKYDLMMFAAPLIAVLGFTFFVLNSENILDFYIKMGLFNAGTVRAIAEMAMGITIYQVYVFMKGRKWTLIGKILLQLLELFAIYRFCALTFFAPVSIDNFRRIPYVLLIILLSFVNVTFLSKLLNRKFMEKLGKISLPMYLIHFPIATIYWSLMFSIKRSRLVWSLPALIVRSGGLDQRNRPIPLSLGDVLMYIPFVIIVSVLLMLFVGGIKRLAQRSRARRG